MKREKQRRLVAGGHGEPGPARGLGLIVAITVPTLVLLHIGAAGPLRESLWGLHVYAFHPRWVVWVASITVPLLGLLLDRSRIDPHRATPRQDTNKADRRRALGLLAASLFGTVVFWIARARHTLLGDGNVIVAGLPDGKFFNARQPLTMLVNHKLYLALESWMDPRTPEHDVAQTAVAIGSVFAGTLFIPVIWGVAQEVHALATTRHAPGPSSASPVRAATPAWLLGAILVSQGYIQLLCGYIEYYAFYLVALAAYIWLGLRYLRRASPFVLPGLAALVAVGFHLSAAIVLPSMGILIGVGLSRASRRRGLVRDLVILAAAAAGLVGSLYVLGGGFNLFTFLPRIARQAVFASAGDSRYMFSVRHMRDFLNEQFLIGPFALLLFIAGLWLCVRVQARRSGPVLFMIVLGLTYGVISWIAGDSNLGYSRNWDLLAPGGLAFATAGLVLILRSVPGALERPRLFAWILIVSLYHTVPWIADNASETKALERMKSLPLGGGRQQMVVGNWYMGHGDYAQARVWLERSYTEFPLNVSTSYLLGTLYALEARTPQALQMLEQAIDMQPQNLQFRRKLVEVMMQGGMLEQSLVQFDSLQSAGEMTGDDWLHKGQVLQQLGRISESRTAFDNAVGSYEERALLRRTDYRLSYNLGEALEQLGRTDSAIVAFGQAVALSPDSSMAHYHLGRLLMQGDRMEEAREHLERVRELDPAGARAAEVTRWLASADR